MTERGKKVLKIWGLGALVLSLYYIWILITNIKLPCIIKLITGLECPGCGTTRMAEALLRFDFSAAFYFNPFMIFALPVLFLIGVWWSLRYVKTGRSDFNAPMWLVLAVLILAMIIFGFLRNI